MNPRFNLFEQKIKKNFSIVSILVILLLIAVIYYGFNPFIYIIGLSSGVFLGSYIGMWYVVWVMKK